MGVGQSLVQKGLLNYFVANYFSQKRPHVYQSVNAGRHWPRSYCFEQRRTDNRKVPKHNCIFKSLWLWRVSLKKKNKERLIYDSVDEELKPQTSVRPDVGREGGGFDPPSRPSPWIRHGSGRFLM